jgi:hypothetical protein
LLAASPNSYGAKEIKRNPFIIIFTMTTTRTNELSTTYNLPFLPSALFSFVLFWRVHRVGWAHRNRFVVGHYEPVVLDLSLYAHAYAISLDGSGTKPKDLQHAEFALYGKGAHQGSLLNMSEGRARLGSEFYIFLRFFFVFLTISCVLL